MKLMFKRAKVNNNSYTLTASIKWIIIRMEPFSIKRILFLLVFSAIQWYKICHVQSHMQWSHGFFHNLFTHTATDQYYQISEYLSRYRMARKVKPRRIDIFRNGANKTSVNFSRYREEPSTHSVSWLSRK